MKKHLVLFAVTTFYMHNLIAFDNRKFFNVKTEDAQKTEISQWAFLEQTFIIDIHREKEIIWNHIYTALPGIFALYAGHQYLNLQNKTQDKNKKDYKEIETLIRTKSDGSIETEVKTSPKDKKDTDILKNLLKIENIYLVTGTIATTMCISQAITCYLNYHFNQLTVKNFLKNWNHNRSLTPSEFHHIFDALTNIMDINGDKAVLDHANEIVDIMQSMIMRHFEKRYETALKIQSVNHLSTTKSIIDILKAAIDTAKGLA